jgi:hypothetical protein
VPRFSGTLSQGPSIVNFCVQVGLFASRSTHALNNGQILQPRRYLAVILEPVL